jgi:DNA polymerase-1
MFTELEFFRLVNEMPAAKATPLRQEAVVVADRAGLEALALEVGKAKRVALAPAWEGEVHRAVMVGLGVVPSGGGCFFVDVTACGGPLVAQVLGPALQAVPVVAHDMKALSHLALTLGLPELTLGTDVELLSYLMNPSRKEHALADLARERLRTELPPWPEGVSGRGKAALAEVPLERRASMFGAQADALERLTDDLWLEADTLAVSTLARELEFPLVKVLAKMERTGLLVDLAALKEISTQVDASVEAMLLEVYKHAGREFNVGSPQQLAQVLYEDLGLPVHKKGKTGPSTDHEVLEKLAEEHPLPRAIIEYRNVAKLKNTYLDTLPLLVGADGRLHTTLHQAQAATGRLTSSNPNLQNIPVRTDLGRQIRRAFVAPPGSKLVSADYSQVELRILAHISQDEQLVDAFHDAVDVHTRTAAQVFGVALEAVTAEQRRAAKMVNYGIAYGLSAPGLAARLNVPVPEAKGIIDTYFARFPGIARYVEGTLEKARRSGYVESLFGRRRQMPDIVSKNRAVAFAAERAAINMPIQGTAADLAKRAMLGLDTALAQGGFKARALLQVHDELLVEAPDAEVERVAALLKQVMTSVATLDVPLVVDVGIGHSWADAH